MEQSAMPQPAEFDAYAESYTGVVDESLAFLGARADYFTRVKAGYILDLLAGHFGDAAQARLLDVGCGVGNLHPLLAGMVGSLAGADVSAACLAQAAKANPGVAYRHGDGAGLPYADASFDAAVTVCVMHHVPPSQWPGFAAELKRVLRPGGLAMVFEHNPLNPLTRRVVFNCEFDRDAVLLGRGETSRLLSGAGFKQIRARSILSLPSSGPTTRKLDALFGRLPLGAQYYATGVA